MTEGRKKNSGQRRSVDPDGVTRIGQAESARDTRQLREEIEQTRAEVAETIEVLAGRAHVRERGREKARHATARAKERLADSAQAVRHKGEHLAHQASERVDAGQQRVRKAVPDQTEEWVRQATAAARRNRNAVIVAVATLLGLGWILRARRQRRVRRHDQ